MRESMTLEYTFKDNSCVELCGDKVKFWEGTGLPNFEGPLYAFKDFYPERFQQLLKARVIKAK